MKLNMGAALFLSLAADVNAAIAPASLPACPTNYAQYISNLGFYVKNEAGGTQKVAAEFSHCYLRRQKDGQDGTIGQLEYLRNVAYITGHPQTLAEAKTFYQNLSGIESQKNFYDKLFDIALIFRDAEFAAILKEKHQINRDIPPSLSHKAARNILKNQNGVRSWHSFEFPQGGHIIVIANEFCAFSQAFQRFLQSELKLNQSIAEQITWLSPVDLQLESGALIHDVYNHAEWPEIDLWETPTIYFFASGQLVSKMIGWPQGGQRDKFVTQAAQIGLTIEKATPPSTGI